MNNKQPFHYTDNGALPQFPSIIPGTPNELYTNLWPQNKGIDQCYTVPDQSAELGSQDFSPGSYGNLASTTETQYCRFANHQWNPSYSSCAQVSQLYSTETGTYYEYPQGPKSYPETVNLNFNQGFYGSSILTERQGFNYDCKL